MCMFIRCIQFQCCGVYGSEDFEQIKTSSLWHKEGRFYVNAEGQEITGDGVGLPVACCRFRNINFPMNCTFSSTSLKNMDFSFNEIYFTDFQPHLLSCIGS